jgi:hypothetical protein
VITASVVLAAALLAGSRRSASHSRRAGAESSFAALDIQVDVPPPPMAPAPVAVATPAPVASPVVTSRVAAYPRVAANPKARRGREACGASGSPTPARVRPAVVLRTSTR